MAFKFSMAMGDAVHDESMHSTDGVVHGSH